MSVKITLFELWKQKEIALGRPLKVMEVAQKTGISRATLIRLRNGKVERPDLEIINKLCRYFNLPSGPVPFIRYEPD